MRLIDADALIADMQERYCKPCKEKGEDYNEVRCRACWVDDAIDEVDGFGDNAIDLVRCKECKHNYNTAINHGKMKPRCDFMDYLLTENDFCSRGERREP